MSIDQDKFKDSMFFFKTAKRKKKGGAKNQMALFFLLLPIVTIGALYFFDLFDYLHFEYLKNEHSRLKEFYTANPFLTMGIYFLTYIFISSFSLPFTAFMTLAGGFIFGIGLGVLLSSFASVLGATFSFLISRFFLYDFFNKKLKFRFRKAFNRFNKEGSYYLFTLRLVPMVPFFLVNILMSLTTIKTRTFFIVSWVAMLPGTVVYAYAGKRLSEIETLNDIMSFNILSSLTFLGIFPLIAKKVAKKLPYFFPEIKKQL